MHDYFINLHMCVDIIDVYIYFLALSMRDLRGSDISVATSMQSSHILVSKEHCTVKGTRAPCGDEGL